jgi:hypothetical protein
MFSPAFLNAVDPVVLVDPVVPGSLPPLPRKAIFKCPHCSHSSSRKNNLSKHVLRRHPLQAGKQKVECRMCGSAFFDKAKLANHQCVGEFKAPPPIQCVLPPDPVLPVPTVQPVPADAAAVHHGMPRLLSDKEIDTAAADFISWWTEAPLTPLEQTVKKTRGVMTEAKLATERARLRHIVRTVHGLFPGSFSAGIHLQLLVRMEVVQSLFADISNRGLVATEYPVALMLKKACVWLCSRQSRDTGRFVSPDVSFSSWGVLHQHAQRGGRDRKYNQKARMVHGVGTEKRVTGPEITVVLNQCLAALHELEMHHTDVDRRLVAEVIQDWMDHLATALLLACIPPRQGTYQHLTVEDVLPPGKDPRCPQQYSMRGRHDKVMAPWWTAVPLALTGAMKFHLQKVLPAGHKGALFLQRGGEPRQDFSHITRRVCEQYIGRPINASKFRKSVTTELIGRPEVNSRGLAQIMGHSEDTQRTWYNGLNYAEQVDVSQRELLRNVVVPVRGVSI